MGGLLLVNWLKNLYDITLILVSVLALLAGGFGIYTLSVRIRILKCLKNRKDKDFLYRLCSCSLKSFLLAYRAVLPLHTAEKSNRPYVQCEMILVTHGGICILNSTKRGGRIVNPRKGDWSRKLPSGEEETFANPLAQGEEALRAVARILREESIPNIPISQLVVTTAPKVAFREEFDELVSAEHLTETVKNLNKNRFLSTRECLLCRKALQKHILRRKNI